MQRSPSLLAAAVLSALAPGAWAHEGHFLAGSHWHATDALGFAVAAGAIVLALWRGRK